MSRSSQVCRRICKSITIFQSQQAAVALNIEPNRFYSASTLDGDSAKKEVGPSSAAGEATSPPQKSSSSPPKKTSVHGRQKSWDASMQHRREDQRQPYEDRQSFNSPPRRSRVRMGASFPASDAFVELLKQARNTTPEEIIKMFDTPEENSKPAQPADYLVLAEVIEAYLSVVKEPNPSIDGLDISDHARLRAFAEVIRDIYGTGGRESVMPPGLEVTSPLETRVVNMAPKGRLPWEVLAVDESRAAVHWAVDLTAGKAKNPWQNARLSHDVKKVMYNLHKEDPEKYSVEHLAKTFKIRQQRVMAILALQEIEETYEWKSKEEEEMAEKYRKYMEEEVFQCYETVGADEKHIVDLPSYPTYATVDAETASRRLEEVLGKPAAEISEEEITPEICRQVIGVKSIEELEEEIAEREEDMMVREFKERLDYNMGKIGKSLQRKKGKRFAPKRPEEGWSLVVTPLGEKKEDHYVAMPDGSKRELNEDEMLLIERKTPKPRRKIV